MNRQSKALNDDYINDTFFNYSFPFPAITPRHHRYLTLLPESWRILDESMRNTHRSGNLGDWVQKVKYRLARHYHKICARNLAKVQLSVKLWVELQNDLAIYSAARNSDLEQIYLDEDHLAKLTDLDQIKKDPFGVSLEGPNNEDSTIVSYLFKRDRWDLSKEWIPFYRKIYIICNLGVPNQLRKIIWSELGRVCYFVKLTDNVLKSSYASAPSSQQALSNKPISYSQKGV